MRRPTSLTFPFIFVSHRPNRSVLMVPGRVGLLSNHQQGVSQILDEVRSFNDLLHAMLGADTESVAPGDHDRIMRLLYGVVRVQQVHRLAGIGTIKPRQRIAHPHRPLLEPARRRQNGFLVRNAAGAQDR